MRTAEQLKANDTYEGETVISVERLGDWIRITTAAADFITGEPFQRVEDREYWQDVEA